MPELRVETGPQKSQTFRLRPPGPYQVGRDLEADFPLFDRRASRTHFRIDFRDEGYSLTDLASKAGTFVNDLRVTSQILKGGDRILAGKTLFSFVLDAAGDPLVGRNLGSYKILERVGRGGMGTVYRALQLSLDRVVALKVLSDELARDPDFSVLFVREARAAGELSHSNIVRVYDVNVLDGILFYVMEYMAHGSVEDLLRREGRLPVERALRIVIEAAAGLEYAEHEGVVHRDIKPANLMIHENGTVKIGDLGIATRLAERGRAAQGGGISGSPHYMAPEQALAREVDGRADIYALGASLHQMLSGSPPFRGRSLKEILFAHIRDEPPDLRRTAPSVPEPLALLVRKMLAKDPSRRPDSAASLRQTFQALRENVCRAPEAPARRPSPAWRSAALLLLSGALVFGVGTGLGALWSHLGSVMRDRSARLEGVRRILAEGMAALKAGDVDGARAKADELSRFEGSLEEWQILNPEIDAFERAVKAAARK